MLSQKRRANTELLKKSLKNKGFFVRSHSFTLRIYSLDKPDLSKIACIASKGHFKKAVARNRARRIVYSIISKISNKLVNSKLLVFNLNKNVLEKNPKELEREIKDILAKSNTYKD